MRIWVWASTEKLAGIVARAAQVRAARACACDNCRLIYDDAFRAEQVRKAEEKRDQLLAELRRRRESAARPRDGVTS